jgi:hypothetical protein
MAQQYTLDNLLRHKTPLTTASVFNTFGSVLRSSKLWGRSVEAAYTVSHYVITHWILCVYEVKTKTLSVWTPYSRIFHTWGLWVSNDLKTEDQLEVSSELH